MLRPLYYTYQTVQNIRDNVNNEFHSIFQTTIATCNKFDINIFIPRITSKEDK